MLTTLVLGICAATAVVAAPHPFADYVENDKITVMKRDGGHEVLDINDWLEHLKLNNISLERPEIDYDWLNFTADIDVDIDVDISKRQSCEDTVGIVIDKTENFVDWDVQMSNVACAVSGPFDIWVASGFSVANSVEISGGISPTPIKERLQATVGVSFSRTWTTSTSIQNKGTVNQGHCGVMITKPLTTRRYGSVYSGCIDKTRKIGTFMADDRGEGSYNGVSWIAGAVAMCEKPGSNPPLSRCSGGGNFK